MGSARGNALRRPPGDYRSGGAPQPPPGAPQPPPGAAVSAQQRAAQARAAAAPYQNELQPVPSVCTNGLERHLHKEGTELLVSNGLLVSATGGMLPADGYPDSVQKIDASANQLRGLPEGLFEGVPQLTALDVSRNQLTELPIDLCECLELRSLRAANNRLLDLTFAAQRPLPALSELLCDRNALTEVPAYLWVCPNLRHVSLCANKLSAASLRMPGAEGGMPLGRAALAPLEMLDLGENRLGALPPLALYPSLREVHVQQNGIRELPLDQLTGLRQLQTLDVSMNDVAALPPQLALLPVLQNLTIIGNPIRSIPQSVQQRGATAVLDLLKKRLPD